MEQKITLPMNFPTKLVDETQPVPFYQDNSHSQVETPNHEYPQLLTIAMASSTLGQIGEEQLVRLGKYLNFSDEKIKRACELFSLTTGDWSSWDKSKIWQNFVTGDMTPWEFSVDMSSDVETQPVLRYMTEPQKEPRNLYSNWEA